MNKSNNSLRDKYLEHYWRRLRERVSEDISRIEAFNLAAEIKELKHDLVAWDPKATRGAYRVLKWGHRFFVIYDYEEDVPVSVLSSEMSIREVIEEEGLNFTKDQVKKSDK